MAQERKYEREELRAILVLGIIGTLLGTKNFTDVSLGFGIHVSFIVNGLLEYWGAYLFLEVMAISSEVIKERVRAYCEIAARLCFLYGLALTFGLTIFVSFYLVIGTISASLLANYAIGVGVVALCAVITLAFREVLGEGQGILSDVIDQIRHKKPDEEDISDGVS